MSRRSNLLYPFYPPASPPHSSPPPPRHCLCLFCPYLSRLPSLLLRTPPKKGLPRDRAIDSRLINAIGSGGGGLKRSGTVRTVIERYSSAIARSSSPTLDDFWERISRRSPRILIPELKTLGPANPRHYAISRGTRALRKATVANHFSPGYEFLLQFVRRKSGRSGRLLYLCRSLLSVYF